MTLKILVSSTRFQSEIKVFSGKLKKKKNPLEASEQNAR